MISKRLKLFLRACKLLALLAYLLVFCELFTRIFAPQAIVPRYVTGGEYGVRANIAGATYQQRTPEVQVEIRINDQGFRSDGTFELDKQDDICRVALFGDSFFMGYEVNLQDSYAHLLEEKLHESGIKTEVINFSVSGLGTAENLIILKNEGLKYKPDVVLFQWHRSDIKDNVRSNLYGLDGGELVEKAPAYLPAVALRDFLMDYYVYRWLINKSHFYSAAREQAADFVKKLIVNVKRISRNSTIEIDSSAEAGSRDAIISEKYEMELAAALLERANSVVELSGGHFAIIEIPNRLDREHFESSFTPIQSRMRSEVRYVSPLGIFHDYVSRSPEKLYYEEGHGHLTPIGNLLLARTTADFLHSSGMLSLCK